MKYGLNRYRVTGLFQLLFLLIATLVLLKSLTSFKMLKRQQEYSDRSTYDFENVFFTSLNMTNYREFLSDSSNLVDEGLSNLEVEPVDPARKVSKIFYTFWSQGDKNVPNLVKRCIISWKVHNPDYTIILVTLSNVEDLIRSVGLELPKSFFKIYPQAQSDWIRLALLSKRGGVWIDASIFMTDSIEPLIETQTMENTNGFMFYLDMYVLFAV